MDYITYIKTTTHHLCISGHSIGIPFSTMAWKSALYTAPPSSTVVPAMSQTNSLVPGRKLVAAAEVVDENDLPAIRVAAAAAAAVAVLNMVWRCNANTICEVHVCSKSMLA